MQTPLIPKTLAVIAAALAPFLAAVAPMLPEVGGVDLGTVAGILAFVSAGLAGLALPRITFGVHAPIIPKVAVPLLAGLVPLAEQLALSMTGLWATGLHALALVLAFLAGLAAPTPLEPAAEPKP